MNAIYEVRWISQRGFANEGDYVYGLTSELDKEDAEEASINGTRQFTVSRHRSMETAMRAAAKKVKQARADTSPSQPFLIGLREAGKVQTMRDQEMVLGIEKGLF